MMSSRTKRLVLLNLPYFLLGLAATKLGVAWRAADGADFSGKMLHISAGLDAAFSTPWPSFLPQDMILGVLFGFGVWLAVYLKGKNAKKYRHGMEYGSARWRA